MTLRRTSSSPLPADLRTAWQRLGDPASLSLPVALIYLPFAFAGPLFIDTQRMGGSVALWFVVGLVGWLVLFAVLTICRYLLRPLRRGRSVATIIAIAAAVATRSIALTLAAQVLGLTPFGDFTYRLNAAIFTQSALLIASAIVVSSYVHNGRLAADLVVRQGRLTKLSSESRARLANLREQISTQVHRSVDPLVAQLDEVSHRAGSSREGFQHAIAQIVDEELRPLSQRLADAATLPSSEEAPPELAKTSRPALPDRVLLGKLFRPVGSTLLAALLASSQAIRAANLLDGVLFTMALALSLGVIVALMRVMTIQVEVRAWVGVAIATVATALSFSVMVVAWEMTPLPMPPDLQWAALYSGLFIGVLLALEYVVNERRSATEDQLRVSVEQLQAQSSMLRQHEYIASRQLSYVVHGSVQAALNAAAMRLSITEHLNQEVIATIRRDIEEAIARIDTSGSAYVMLVQSLADLVDLWEGTAQVRWTMDHRTIRSLAESPPTAASVGEIITECTSNAIRHGRATKVDIRIEATGDIVVVHVVDDGAGLPTNIEPRLGTRMLDELCLYWSRCSADGATTVTAQLATDRALQATA